MITTYSRGNVTLTVDTSIGADRVMFTISRAAALTDDEVRRVNAELADYSASHGAQLLPAPDHEGWEIRSDTVLASDHGNETAELKWVAHP
ncbi:hypothetical protein [Mycolicibacterium goodii]|uniref:hypothetical protein n=1 Tax=Mycolicibacterium goodii TaxID=134601 RepID=UPI001BDCF2FA|nr:hypothetical protein [Mycolicibacterium goodii]MBU8839068.1 hypothetical protein [Mycolicibacterium goodii]